MRAEVISIGDELTSGARLDTNTQWLSQQLGELGIRVAWQTTVGDELPVGTDAFRLAAERAALVVCTGGLGPTADDLTRECLAAAARVELIFDPASWEHIRGLFARRGRSLPERNRVQAMFPRGSRAIANPHGTAPGIDIEIPGPEGRNCRVFALPGVPGEMREMWFASVRPTIAALPGRPQRVIRHRQLRCYGAGESAIEAMLPDLVRRGNLPTVGITASQATITLRIMAEAESEQACQSLIEPAVSVIRGCLGELVYGEGEDELQDAVVRELVERSLTLATVESDSGGRLANWLSEADPARRVFRGGLTIRDPNLPAWLGGVPSDSGTEQPLWLRGLPSLAASCRDWFNADLGLALGPFPPHDAGASVPAEVHFALADAKGVAESSTAFAGHPEILLPRTLKEALHFLRSRLRSGLGQR